MPQQTTIQPALDSIKNSDLAGSKKSWQRKILEAPNPKSGKQYNLNFRSIFFLY